MLEAHNVKQLKSSVLHTFGYKEIKKIRINFRKYVI